MLSGPTWQESEKTAVGFPRRSDRDRATEPYSGRSGVSQVALPSRDHNYDGSTVTAALFRPTASSPGDGLRCTQGACFYNQRRGCGCAATEKMQNNQHPCDCVLGEGKGRQTRIKLCILFFREPGDPSEPHEEPARPFSYSPEVPLLPKRKIH